MSKKLIRGKSFTANKPATVKLAFSKRKREGKLTRQMTEEVKRVTLSLVETKQKLTYSTTQPIDTPDVILLNGIGQGDDNLTREGNRIRVSSIELRFAAVSQSITTVPTGFYLALVLDRQPNGSAPNVNDVYDDIGGAQDPLVALRNNRYLERFKVLWRSDYCIGKYENQGLPLIQDHVYVDLTKQKDEDVTIRYNGSSATVSGISKNAFYLMCVPSNQALFAAGSNYHQWEYMVKLNFKDA